MRRDVDVDVSNELDYLHLKCMEDHPKNVKTVFFEHSKAFWTVKTFLKEENNASKTTTYKLPNGQKIFQFSV